MHKSLRIPRFVSGRKRRLDVTQSESCWGSTCLGEPHRSGDAYHRSGQATRIPTLRALKGVDAPPRPRVCSQRVVHLQYRYGAAEFHNARPKMSYG